MKGLCVNLVALMIYAVATVSVRAAGVDELGRYLGTWTSPGTLYDTPYSKAGTATATTTCAWSQDHVFMICQQSITLNGKPNNALSIYTYDTAKSVYRFFNIGTDGADGSVISVEGDTITYSNSFTDKGKQVTIRTLNVWESPMLYRWRTEYSADSGKTWTPMAVGTAQRQ